LIHVYNDPDTEFEALAAGDIDITDWSFSKTWVDTFNVPGSGVALRSYADIGHFEIDINNQRWPTGVATPRTLDPATGTYKHYYTDGGTPGVIDTPDEMATEFRKAIHHLTDKDEIVTDILKGYGAAQDSMAPTPALSGYLPPDIADHTYDYNPATAAALLDAVGFTEGSTPNPHYDAGFPNSAQYIRTDPLLGGDLAPLKMWIRLDDPNRKEAGLRLSAKLNKMGIPCEGTVSERTVCYNNVMVLHDFHLYTGGWGLSADVPDSMHFLFHSEQYWGGTTTSYYGGLGWSVNYDGFCDTEYDYWAEGGKFGTDLGDGAEPYLVTECKDSGFECIYRYLELSPCIDLYAFLAVKGFEYEGAKLTAAAAATDTTITVDDASGFEAGHTIGLEVPTHANYETGVISSVAGNDITLTAGLANAHPADTLVFRGYYGTVNYEGTGPDNGWSFLNMEKPGDNTIDWGFKSNLESLNIVTAEWLWDHLAMGVVYESMIGRNPYNLAEETGLLAEYWTGLTETSPGSGQYYVDFRLRDGATFHGDSDGVAGRDPVTPQDVKFTLEFQKACGPGVAWIYSDLANVQKVETQAEDGTLGPRDVRIYFMPGVQSYWAVHWVGFPPVLSRNVWKTAGENLGWWDADNAAPGDGGYYDGLTDFAIFTDREDVRNYDPATYDGDSDGDVDFIEDGAGPWIFVSMDGLTVSASTSFAYVADTAATYFLSQDYIHDYTEWAFWAGGDTSRDRVIDIGDGFKIGLALGSEPGDLNWDVDADIQATTGGTPPAWNSETGTPIDPSPQKVDVFDINKWALATKTQFPRDA
jgi:hypothetical protein